MSTRTTAAELRNFIDRFTTEVSNLADRAGGEREFVVEILSAALSQRLERLQLARGDAYRDRCIIRFMVNSGRPVDVRTWLGRRTSDLRDRQRNED